MPPKRKRTQGTKAVRSSKKPKPQTDHNARCSFLIKLPLELRNAIYNLIVPETNTAFILPTGIGQSKKHRVIADHPLSYVCRQVHREFSEEVGRYSFASAQNIVGEVADFNFHALEAYLKRTQATRTLSDFTLEYAESGDKGGRRLVVALSISTEWCDAPDVKSHGRWCQFLKKVAQMEEGKYVPIITYVIKHIEDRESARKIINRIASGQQQSEAWAGIRKAYEEWYRLGYDGGIDALFSSVKRQRDIDGGELQVYEDDMRSVLEADASDEEEDLQEEE